ncbi:AI-2E family transporter [Corticibacter populi]|uniref:AI-2E family transporter n=1 Tax=Corticibacter populi TaxID=1550736 RepID=A0A3M6QUB9_9BURK|nr:AI-2E family transporter [Corticibacter populi]RMX06563.1 AI-2E family transporter [Corticibacter populi]RZS31870.1 putative PurR-regulated permease PerM [Corticibacter populi]
MNSATLQSRAFIGILLAVTAAFFVLLKPFYAAIFWAATLAVLFWPIHQRVLARMPGRTNLAAVLTLLICLLIVIIPLLLVTTSLVQEIVAFYNRINREENSLQGYYEQIVAAIPPQVWSLAHRFGLDSFAELQPKLFDAINQAARIATTHALSVGQNTLQFGLAFALMLYLLFFFFRDGASLMAQLRRAIPLDKRHLNDLSSKFSAVVKATVKGSIVVAAVQGALGGLMFWALGIQGAILWGVVMAILSLLPAVGAGLVWAPVAIYLLATGSIAKGVIMIVIGVGVIGLVDNILRPILVGKETKMPDYLVLLSTLGGISLFGLTGFVAGPVIAALFIAIWAIFTAQRHQHDNDAAGPGEAGSTAPD